MGFLEGFLYVIWRGIAIGIIISAPMGPVGILCVQRTLEKGRKTGLFTGVGATISDLFYCLLTGFGLSFIEEFLERNQNIIQLIGSVVLVAFAVYLFKSNPSRKLKKPDENSFSAKKNILNGFLFTFSNPLIIFLIIGLFARFNFMVPGLKFYHYIVGFAAIAAGALLWWYLVSFFIDKVRSHFNLRSMWLINKIIGGVILIFAIVGMVTSSIALANAVTRAPVYMNSYRGFELFGKPAGKPMIVGDSLGKADTITLAGPNDNHFTISFRAANCHNGSGKKYPASSALGKTYKVAHPSWGMKVVATSGEEVTIELKTHDNPTDETYSPPFILASAYSSSQSLTRPNPISTKKITEGIDFFTDTNAFRLDFNGHQLSLSGGNRGLYPIISFDFPQKTIKEIKFFTSPGGLIELDFFELVFPDSRLSLLTEYGDKDVLETYLLRSKDKMEGIWAVYDRMLEEDLIRLGGNYRFALISNADGLNPGGYDLIYLDGAKISPEKWKPGMIKARLHPSGFENIWNVEWTDATGVLLDEEVRAELVAPVLSLEFPYRATSRLRLRKLLNR